MYPKNHRKRWNESDLSRIKTLATTLKSKEDMYALSKEIAKDFGRTVASVCKKIEIENQWYWASKK